MRESKNGTVRLGYGLLTTISVMGTVLAKAAKLSSKASGNVLIIARLESQPVPKMQFFMQRSIGF